MMTYDDRGEGGLRNNDIINKGSFLQQYPKKITQSKLFYALNSNCAWNSFQKERHIVYVVEKKYTLNEGGGSLKNDVSTMGGFRIDDT